MTVVNRKTEPGTGRAALATTSTASLTAMTPCQRQNKVSTSRTCGTRHMTILNTKRCLYCARPERNYSMRQNREYFQRGAAMISDRAFVQPNRSISIRELQKVTTCSRCGALGHWEDDCVHKGHRKEVAQRSDRYSGSASFRKQASTRKSSPAGKGESKWKEAEEWSFWVFGSGTAGSRQQSGGQHTSATPEA